MPAPNGLQVYADNASLILNIHAAPPNGAPEPVTLAPASGAAFHLLLKPLARASLRTAESPASMRVGR